MHGEQNSFGRARFLVTPSLARATRLAVGARCALHSTVAVYLRFLPAKDAIWQLGGDTVHCGDGGQYNYSLEAFL